MKSVINGAETTYFVGNYYEVTGSTITKYYYAGAQRIAMRKDGTLNYLLGDHLGSTSLTTDATGNVVSELRYKAWGEVRYASGTTSTNYTYTGQYSYASDFGLLFYNARWYDPYLNQFTQPDTIVPDPYNSLDWNRYSYARYNPVRYTDPSGHMVSEDDGGGTLENTLKYFEKYGKHKDRFNELYATVYFAEQALANALSDGQISESELIELKAHDDMVQIRRGIVLSNLGQDEFDASMLNVLNSSILGRAIRNAKIVDGFSLSLQPSLDPEIIGGAAAAVVVVFGHGARHLKGLPVTQAEVELAITRSVELNVSPTSTGLYKGYVTVNGIKFEYHAYPVGNNIINVGTYYPENR